MGKQAADDLLDDLSYRACVDRHLQDQVRYSRNGFAIVEFVFSLQLIILMALAKGHSKIRCGPLSDHTKTAIYISERLTKVNTLYEELCSSTASRLLQVKFTVTEAPSTSDRSKPTTIIECDGLGYQRRS